MRAAGQIGDFWLRFDLAQKDKDTPNNEPPETTDPLAAVFACHACQNRHCAALVEQREVRESTPWVDPPRAADAVGDGNGQADGDGPET